MTSVLLVDDQELVRAGMRALLERADDIEVVGESASGSGGVALARAVHPDVVLMDIRMPGTDGITATRTIVEDHSLASSSVIVLTTFDTDQNVLDAIRAGADGFLLKDTGPEALREAVRIVAAGEALLSPAVTRRVMQAAAASAQPSPERLDVLTEREREVLVEVGAARSNTEIAARLLISPATVRTHVGRLLGKLDARDRTQLVVIAYETGVIRPGAEPDPRR